MAVHIQGIFNSNIYEKIKSSKILVVGAGGIGCELLKNLVLTGFEIIHVIDLDTIELSNLNRQFLFHKQHIGRPKAVVAKESVLKFNPKAQITAYHDSITKEEYDVSFFKQFTAVLNALDNVAARSHVNRMCLAADIPLIESGTAGYVGQVTVYKKKLTECYECIQRRGQKTYPGCTIRNTPSQPVHCIVWAKNLFNQLFGESLEDEDVSPDLEDPHLEKDSAPPADGNVVRVSTREWAKACNYDPVEIFKKLFGQDIDYLNSMNSLWTERPRPKGLDFDNLPDAVASSSKEADATIKDQMLWSIKQCGEIFADSLCAIRKKSKELGPDSILTWDKDEDDDMNFVASVANLRSYCFGISQKSRFDIKAIAGNIIPAIASTNAVIAGLIVLEIIKVLQGDISQCRTAFLKESGIGGKILPSTQLEKPNPKCMVCSSETPEVVVKVNVATLTLKTLYEKVLREKLHMTHPDVILNDGSATILVSSDPEERDDDTMNRVLADFNLAPSIGLVCEDFLQHYKLQLILAEGTELKDQEFEVVTDIDDMVEQQDEDKKKEASKEKEESTKEESEIVMEVSEQDDLIVITEPSVEDEDIKEPLLKKRKLSDDENGIVPGDSKKNKTEEENAS